jgi:hypothetical protein
MGKTDTITFCTNIELIFEWCLSLESFIMINEERNKYVMNFH